VETSCFVRFAGILVMLILAAGCGDSRPTTAPNPAPPAPTAYDAVAGVYRLTFDASPSCDLPEEASHRTYTATIGDLRGYPTVFLTDAQFYTDDYCGVMNRSDARVIGNTLLLDDYAGDCGIIELLPNSRFLKLWGGAKATITDDRITGLFNGLVNIGSDLSKPTASCTATDHRLVFERMQ